MNETNYDVVIVGCGPAGMAAGIYCGRAKLKTIIMEQESLGGHLINMDMVENYPGFDSGIMAPDLAASMVNQTANTGIELDMSAAESIEVGDNGITVHTSSGDCQTKALILASGSHHKKLGVPGEEELEHNGVFYCAICDGSPYANKTVVVAGGGDSGITEALYMARIASKVIVLEAMPACAASSVLLERARANPKIEINCNFRIEKINGEGQVTGVDVLDAVSGTKSTIPADGVLIRVGVAPNTDWLKGVVPLNERGQVKVNDRLESEVRGVYSAGDCRASSPCQISSAVGDGATAAISVQRYLNSLK